MRILVIEDEKLLADSIRTLLTNKGFEVEVAYDGETGEEYAELGIYDLLILDVMMPKMNGYEVARKVRSRKCGTPILMLTARSGIEDRITGLNSGADYYLAKPFDTRELLACINALLRRQGTQVDEISYGNTSLDLSSAMLVCGANTVRLSAKEFDIMRFLLHLPYEMQDDVRLPYFTLQLSIQGDLIATGGGYYDLSDEAFLKDLIGTTFSSPGRIGIIEEYHLRFYRTDTAVSQILVYADISNEQTTLHNLLRSCILIGGVCFLIFLCISFLLAGWVAKPIDKAWDQQRRFIADASHELKTPLTVIMTNAELMQNTDCDEADHAAFASNILIMSRQMRSLVEQMLELARTDSIRAASFSPVDFSRLVFDAILPFEPVFFEKGLTLHTEIAENITVSGDPSKLRQVLDILLDNAQKYSRAEGTTRVSLQKHGKGHCLLAVANEGDEISPKDLHQLFKRFYRVDQARTGNGSFGLGLSIAETIAAQHKGRIWAESEGHINTFYVELPSRHPARPFGRRNR